MIGEEEAEFAAAVEREVPGIIPEAPEAPEVPVEEAADPERAAREREAREREMREAAPPCEPERLGGLVVGIGIGMVAAVAVGAVAHLATRPAAAAGQKVATRIELTVTTLLRRGAGRARRAGPGIEVEEGDTVNINGRLVRTDTGAAVGSKPGRLKIGKQVYPVAFDASGAFSYPVVAGSKDLPLGSWVVVAEWDGDAQFLSAISNPFTIDVIRRVGNCTIRPIAGGGFLAECLWPGETQSLLDADLGSTFDLAGFSGELTATGRSASGTGGMTDIALIAQDEAGTTTAYALICPAVPPGQACSGCAAAQAGTKVRRVRLTAYSPQVGHTIVKDARVTATLLSGPISARERERLGRAAC